MRLLLRSETSKFTFTREYISDNQIPPYAILSHTWGPDSEEVTFEDITNGIGEDKPGYEKIRFCGEQARQDGLLHFWIDTCCINKTNDAELSRSINSMFRWYRSATRCYVFLSDVFSPPVDAINKCNPWLWESDLQRSRWFTRGWTLQELLALASVEFFSREHKRLGDKSSMQQLICEITNIPHSALQGDSLSQFSVEDRLRWIEHRQTKLEEDKVYSLLGIFGVYILPIYGEGTANALARLWDELHKMQKCIQDLRLTDPRDDKKRIEDTKGGLLEDLNLWILENSDFQQWFNSQQSQLLWIKGDPGKGKTMLLCGIINELKRSIAGASSLSFFFCQGTDSRINNATAVLRGLIYLLADRHPSLISYIRKKYDHAGGELFKDVNSWAALSGIFLNILQDPILQNIFLVIDALDECITDLPLLLALIIQTPSSSCVKWILSSRHRADIERGLQLNSSRARLSLELKENAIQVSSAVHAYIDHCVSGLPEIQHKSSLQNQIRDILQRKSNGTFLWVALVVQELRKAESWEVLDVINEAPAGLEELYHRMIKQIQRLDRRKPELCRAVLSVAITAYHPLHLAELGVLSGLPPNI
jgi:hypothetical protein